MAHADIMPYVWRLLNHPVYYELLICRFLLSYVMHGVPSRCHLSGKVCVN